VKRGDKEIILPLNGIPSDRSPKTKAGESFDWGPLDVEDDAMGDAAIVQWASQRLSRPQQSPMLLAVGFYRPHIPLFAPQKYFQSFPTGSIVLPPSPANDLDDLGDLGRRIALEADTAGLHATVVKHDQWRPAVAAYLACVTFVDAQIGKLLDALEAGPHADNTLVVLFSDHGWHLGEKQHWGKWTGWERATRVPLLIVPPRSAAAELPPGICREPVGLIDLFPTLVAMCGLPAVDGLDGTSLVPLLRNPQAATQRTVVTTFDRGNYSVRDARWRWIRYRDGSEELYDHQTDPQELKNLAGESSLSSVKTRLARSLPATN
jgi:arylsulfatase A-like enzyme